MPIISRIGRRSPKVRALYVGMYAFLILGAATMVYPFLIMISGSTKSAVDIKYFDVVPRFLREDVWLYRKHIEALFNERVLNMNIAYDNDMLAFEVIEEPVGTPYRALSQAWHAFVGQADLPSYAYTIGHFDSPTSKTVPLYLRSFKGRLKTLYGKNLDVVNRALGLDFVGWSSMTFMGESYLLRRERASDTLLSLAIADFKADAPEGSRTYFSPEGLYKKLYLKSLYSRNIAEYNEAHQTAYPSYADVHLARRFPAQAAVREQEDWETFVRDTLASQWIKADAGSLPVYRSFLAAKHRTIESLNRNYGTQYASFEDIPLVEDVSKASMCISDWEAFIVGWRDPETGASFELPREQMRIQSVEFLFQDYVESKYGTIESANAALGASFKSFSDVRIPQAEVHYAFFLDHRKDLRWEFVTRNYKTVAEYLLLHGRGIFNTVVYCSLAVFLALLINPLAAYAMSRYKMPSTYKILLFLMCTMAFPPMVTQIPNFLMLRKLGLLNTFAALVLPGMANGYAIFLLKGFFDSHPRELYESAQLDGAGEWTLFWQITMSLSKPILAVIALQAFTRAYSNFMFAFVVCQDQKMWTLMVWLYQLQQRSGQAVMYASLIIAAIPTFLIFLFCQNIIMRGIVVPSEK